MDLGGGCGRSARRLGEGVHGCVAPALCDDLARVSWVTRGAPARRVSVHKGELVDTVKACGRTIGCGRTVHDGMVEMKVGTGGRRVGQAVLRVVSHDLGGCQGLASGTACGQVYTVWASMDQTKCELGKTCDKANDGLESRVATVRRCRRSGQSSLPKLENWFSVNLGFPKI